MLDKVRIDWITYKSQKTSITINLMVTLAQTKPNVTT